MEKREVIISDASRVFEAGGFRGTGVDEILSPSGTSTRTLYKHFKSRDGLVVAVLEERHRQFMERLAKGAHTDPIAELFDALQRWLDEHGARGCMLLRARSEYASASADIVSLVSRQKDEFTREISRRVAGILQREDATLTTQIWLLFEGATAAASVSETAAVIEAAKQAAGVLLSNATQQSK